MSHQTGITASEDLRNFFATSKDGSIRLMKIGIDNEELVLLDKSEPRSSWEEDYDAQVLPHLDEKQPCYIFYRMDSTDNSDQYEWIYLSWSPDFASVKHKMLFAATRATLKREFGGGQVKWEIFGTVKEDLSLSGFRKHVEAHDAPAPLTFEEEELAMIKSTEVKADIGVDTKHQTLSGVAFPIEDDALHKIMELGQGEITYVQLSVDLENEKICLEAAEDLAVSALPSRVPADHARYHLFKFKHTHEGDYLQSIIFIYSMPGYKCSVKERMLYSSCKSPVIEMVEQLGLQVDRKLEIDSGEELSEAYLYDELHPKKNIAKQAFAKPKGPAGRGPKRMTKPRAENGE
ncbi:twinfilin-1 isoform X2 [Lingula anatina]|uniref:Twinfilin n=1 Tax=Lingula anatina TaxID=7574 RepID=A0A1S3JFW0_LINAN|nr:twinfilin-1 isoform X2 [Lingula anatina]|eukprot:XP_013408784.1 twinfilin-1 isoform X2 [Lingula anatina]